MSNKSWRTQSPGPFTAEGMKEGGYYELSNGHPVELSPSKDAHGSGNALGALVLSTDPLVRHSGVDLGHKLDAHTLRAPDVSVGSVPGASGWAEGAPPLAVEYAGEGSDEAELQRKIAELLEAGSRQVWVVRLVGPRRVEVYEQGKPLRVAVDRDELALPGVLENPVPAAALYERETALAASLRNLLGHFGYRSLDAVRAEGKAEGEARGKAEGKAEGRAEGKAESVLRVLEARGLALTEAQRARVLREGDAATLDRWLVGALTAGSAAAVLDEP